MNITLKNRSTDVRKTPFTEKPYYTDRIGFWGDVTAVYSDTLTCDVLSDTGFTYTNIPVATKEWVTPLTIAQDIYTDRDYSTAERNLPIVGSRVFVLTPTRTATGAFILCSGYTFGDTETHIFHEENKEYIREKKTQGGWSASENYKNGNLALVSNDGNINVEINIADDDDNSKTKGITITAWEHTITITEDGLTVSLPTDANITIEGALSVSTSSNCDISVDGDAAIDVSGNVDVTATQTTINGNTKVTGGQFECGGTVSPTGSGALCGISVCPFSGAPHTGSISSNT